MTNFASAALAAFTLVAPNFAAGSAYAQQAPNDAEGDVIVVTGIVDQLRLNTKTDSASRLNLTPLETPASIETLDGDAIRLRGDLTIQDAAARATGIVNTSGVFGYGLSARGFTGQNSVMTLYDGMRMYNNTLTFPADPWMAQSVEILRGPASVLYGEGAIGGAVNVTRRQPGDTLEIGGRAGVASFGTYSIAAGAGGPVNDLVGFRADASYRRSDGWMDRGDSSALALSGAVRLKPAPDLSITLSHDFSTQKPRTWFGVPLVNGKLDKSIRRNNYNVTDANLRFRDNWSQAKLEWSPSEAIAIRSTFYHLWANKYWNNAENVTYVPATATSPAKIRQSSFLELYHIQKQTGNRTTANIAHDLGGLENQLVVGFDVNRISYKNVSNSGNNQTRLIDVVNPVPGLFIDQASAPTKPRYTNKIRQYSIFAEDRLKFSDQFSLVGGLRYDRPEITKTDYVNAANNFTGTPDAVTWRVGAVYNPIPTLSLYGQYATAADPVGALVSTSLAQSSFDLSTGRQYEVGIKHIFWGGRGQFTLAAYDIVKKKLLTSDPLTPTIQVQVGQQSSRGAEASLSLEPVEGVSISLNGSVLRARYDDFAESVGGVPFQRAGNRPTNVATRTANAFVSWEFLDGWIVDGGVSHVGKRYQDAANTRVIPAYTLTDIGLRWQFVEAASVALRLRNVFDETYVRATYGASQWVLGDPRAVEASLNVGF
ncbi:TonB-dependent siderophore receptor [Novosphingobium sp. P6W]|uniref:TonB-dependent receptor n=1 Tax=Novosphingobium sp. P6W TaxID=1609758 RepID=UPI0006966FAE|nr:TonB-dependent siderophore receptor [Novosphingobium sp. P6W]AXB79172.1 TonB-dependent siderophore receptor [Novosphingobium sp. P6W]